MCIHYCVCVCVCVCVHTHTHKYTHTGFGQSGRTPLRARAPSAGGAGPTGTRNSTSLEARAANVSTSRRRMSEMWRPVEPLAHTFSKVIVLVHAPYKGTAESAVENLCIPGRFLGTIESLAAAPTRSCCGKTAVRGTHSQPSVARILNRPTRSCCGRTAVRGTHSQPSVPLVYLLFFHTSGP